MMNNPLLETCGLPLFASICPEHIEPAVDQVLAQNRIEIDRLLESTTDYSWDNIIQPLEVINNRLHRIWSPISHLHAVVDTDDWRQAYNACLPKLSAYETELGQNKALYMAYKCVADSDAFAVFDEAQKSLLKQALREFRLAGIELDEAKQQDYKAIRQALSQLQTKFEENLLDATDAWSQHVIDKDKLSGLPESVLALAQQKAHNVGKQGWLLTLDFPSYVAIMKYADDVALREEVYFAYQTRASDQAADRQWDNSAVMHEILLLRQQQAVLLGYSHYAHYSLETKMAEDSDAVLSFLNDLAQRSKPMAIQELQELQAFATTEFGLGHLQAWDMNYYSEKMRQRHYQFSGEELRSYFALPQVLTGLFVVVEKLYGIEVKQRKQVEVWHDDVCFFDVFDDSGTLRGSFYLDAYARTGKRGGAWMDECIVRSKLCANLELPVAYINCNFTTPINALPSLLTHDDVVTLFHEFGHALHHILTLVDYPSVAGINGVCWDMVELPSQFMENWCWQREAIDLIGCHYQTGDKISADTLTKVIRAKNFQSGMQMLRQLEFALFDWQLHLVGVDDLPVDMQSLLNDVRQQVAVIIPPVYNRFQHSFSHVFAGGYAAGYYSYKWAEMLSADTFSRFEEEGIFNPALGRDFLHSILEQGGTKDAMTMVASFMGRKPTIDALLKHNGIRVDHSVMGPESFVASS